MANIYDDDRIFFPEDPELRVLGSTEKLAQWRHRKRTQVSWTCQALTQGRTINHMDEIGETMGWRLGAIIHNLRRRYHWPIETEYKGPERIAHYRLAKRTDWRALEFPQSAKALRRSLKAGNETGQGGAPDAAGDPDDG